MLIPTQDYILIKPLIRKQSESLLVVSHETHCRGTVMAVGPGKLNKTGNFVPLDVTIGDTVAFGDGNFDFYTKYSEPQADGTTDTYRIIQEADVVFVVEPEEADTVTA